MRNSTLKTAKFLMLTIDFKVKCAGNDKRFKSDSFHLTFSTTYLAQRKTPMQCCFKGHSIIYYIHRVKRSLTPSCHSLGTKVTPPCGHPLAIATVISLSRQLQSQPPWKLPVPLAWPRRPVRPVAQATAVLQANLPLFMQEQITLPKETIICACSIRPRQRFHYSYQTHRLFHREEEFHLHPS